MVNPPYDNDDTADYIAITRLQARYADVVNRRTWPELEELFDAGAPIRVDTVTAPAHDFAGPVELGAFIGGAIERFDFFEFVILNTVVTVGDPTASDTATGRVFMCEIRHDRESAQYTVAFGVYHDRYRRTAAGWRFAQRDYQSLARTEPNEAFPFPARFVDFTRQEHSP
jgi:hypothetical protein